MRRFIPLFFLFIFLLTRSQAQELRCAVSVTAPSIAGSDRTVYEVMQQALYEFMNSRQWTKYKFTQDERIDVNILITIQDRISTDEFKGNMQIQARRPVFKTSYNTTLLNHIDNDIHFKYVEQQPLEFAENTHTSNLTSLMAFYAYMVLGLDFDSFSKNGGTPYYEKAQTIVITAQNASEKGWKAFESQRNRYWFVENMLNSQYTNVRDAIYTYHRLGLDQMYDNIENGRASVVIALEALQKVHRQKPGSYLMQIFFSAKSDEFVNIFTEAPPMDKPRVVNILREIDPTNTNKYQKILTGNK
ncbi:MAG: hypothetical protein BWY70_01476 [Bacteroidetes bacterium ADurb.Bin408]|nr:MAG: hypothetical protein BWY70_01476 [Bacteroidetes bacterium ADurb.Bin408]